MRIASTRTLLIVLVAVAAAWPVGSTFTRGGEPMNRRQDAPVGVWRHIGPIPIIPGEPPKIPARYNSGRVISIAANPGDPRH